MVDSGDPVAGCMHALALNLITIFGTQIAKSLVQNMVGICILLWLFVCFAVVAIVRECFGAHSSARLTN